MSRAININASMTKVRATCEKEAVTISAIEELQSGGTRVVLSNVHDAAVVTRVFSQDILEGPARRAPLAIKRVLREVSLDAGRSKPGWTAEHGVSRREPMPSFLKR